MTGKSEELYRRVFQELADFGEHAMNKACFFHSSQCVWRKIQSCGLASTYADDEDSCTVYVIRIMQNKLFESIVLQQPATLININAKLSGLFWARHEREVCSSPGRSSCLQASPSDGLPQGPQLSALTLSRRALVHLVSQTVERAPNRPSTAATRQQMSDNEQTKR
ncbi:hypothetical protein M514_27923, partial [Trichuris suis]